MLDEDRREENEESVGCDLFMKTYLWNGLFEMRLEPRIQGGGLPFDVHRTYTVRLAKLDHCWDTNGTVMQRKKTTFIGRSHLSKATSVRLLTC